MSGFSFALSGLYTDYMVDMLCRCKIDYNTRKTGLKRKLDICTDNGIKTYKMTIRQEKIR